MQNVTGLRGLSSYNAKHKRFDCDVVYTNIPVPGAYRGYGAPQAEFALESHMEDIALQMGWDPMEFKRKNWVKVGDRLDIVTRLGERGESLDLPWDQLPMVMTSGIEECIAQGKRAIGWHRRIDPAWIAPADRPNIRRGHRVRLLHARLGDSVRRHGRLLDEDQRRRLVQPRRRRRRPWHRCGHGDVADRRRSARRAARRHHRVHRRHRSHAVRCGCLCVVDHLHLGHGGEEGRRRVALEDQEARRRDAGRRSAVRDRAA